MSNAYRSTLAGGGSAPVGDATAADVLSGKTFSGAVGSGVTGTMTNNGAVSGTATPTTPYTIPEGYHNGLGQVTAAVSQLIATGQGIHFSTSTCEYIQLSTSPVNLVKAAAYVLNVDGYDTITVAGAGTLPTKIGLITNGVVSLETVTNNTAIDISGADFVTIEGDGTSTFTLGVTNP